MMTPRIFVAAVGMLTPVGFDSVSTAAAVRAGMSAYEDSSQYNKRFHQMRMALAPEDALPPLNPELESVMGMSARQSRMLRLATPALQEAMGKVPLKEPPPLFLALPESIPEYSSTIGTSFLDHLIVQTGVAIDRKSSRIIATGRAGGLDVIDLVFKYFNASGKDVALVGGVDTYLDPLLLGVLDSENRVLADNIPDGFAPGEAAGFLLLVSERVVAKLPFKVKAALYSPGLANEKGHRFSEEPYRGEGLAEAFNKAIMNSNGAPISSIYASLNGENFGAKELGLASMRNKNAFITQVKVEHPADCFGDVGAAFGPILIGLTSFNPPGNYLGYCSSDQQSRAAIVTTIV
jgi:3-oxoacyl-[acyl-carrier-protein] synthase-1